MSYPQTIYNICRQQGMTEAAALATVGNFQCESNCEPFRVEGDFSPDKTISKAYVQGVTNGSISRNTFSHDAKGFGLYQLTFWSRKQEYYDYWKAHGGNLDSAELQTKFAIKEMRRDFPNLWNFLTQTTDIYTACSRICREFERPAFNNVDDRSKAANKYKNELDLNNWQSGGDEPEPKPVPKPDTDDDGMPITETWPPRTIDKKHCTGWPEIKLAQALLSCHGYNVLVDGIFSDTMEEKVRDFQKANGLYADGVIGKGTFSALGIKME